jgi:hypothetical protein
MGRGGRFIVISRFNLLLYSVIYFSLISIFLISGTIPSYHTTLAFTPDPLNQTSNAGSSSAGGGPSFLKVIVHVDNTGGGTAKPSDFTVEIWGDNDADPWHFDGSTAGTISAMKGDGDYQIKIVQKSGVTPSYGVTFSGDCKIDESGHGFSTIDAGDRNTCIATMIHPGF